MYFTTELNLEVSQTKLYSNIFLLFNSMGTLTLYINTTTVGAMQASGMGSTGILGLDLL